MKVYQIEVSNLCNLTCNYCPHPAQVRPRGLMSAETFAKAIQLLRRCGQRRAYLHNFGEPLLHPELPTFIERAVAAGISCCFYSNGVLLDKSMLARLFEAGLREICISGHVAGEIDRVRSLICEADIPIPIADVFRPAASTNHSWAGQVAANSSSSPTKQGLPVVGETRPCIFERENAFVILWDGRVNVCCIDSEAVGVSLTIDDLLDADSPYLFSPISLCEKCNLMRGDEALE